MFCLGLCGSEISIHISSILFIQFWRFQFKGKIGFIWLAKLIYEHHLLKEIAVLNGDCLFYFSITSEPSVKAIGAIYYY